MIVRYPTRRCLALLVAALPTLMMAAVLNINAPTWATDTATEEARLAALLRQLDTLQRLAQQSAEQSATHGSRYHFDYARLNTDIARIRAGIEDYLSPIRAQPRDPQALSGQYRRDEDSAP